MYVKYLVHCCFSVPLVLCCVGVICIITAAAEITEFLLVKLRRYLSWSASSKTRIFNAL